MPDQYRRDYEHESRRGRRGSGSDREDYERGEDGGRRASEGREERGQQGRGDYRNRDEDDYGSRGRGIARESGWDRGGWGRDERDSRDWQQRVDESQQGYRTRDPMFDRGWQREPDWRSERQREGRLGRDWPEGGGPPMWRGEDDTARWRPEARGWETRGSGRRWGTGSALARDWHSESYGGPRSEQGRAEPGARWSERGMSE
jgi:hypothetical protein